MKSKKGQINYLAELKKFEIINCIVEWSLVVVLILLGGMIFEKLFNIITLVAVVGSFFAIKDTLILSVKIPFKPMDLNTANKLKSFGEYITLIYNPLMASRDKIMGIDAIAISETTVLVCITNPKTDAAFTEAFLNKLLAKRKIERLNIKCYSDHKSFIDRVEGLHNMAKITKKETTIEEKKIRSAILRFCM